MDALVAGAGNRLHPAVCDPRIDEVLLVTGEDTLRDGVLIGMGGVSLA